MTKRVWAALLCAVLALSLLTGCAARTTVAPGTMTAEEAQAIALSHAGFTAEQVSFLRTEPELRDRVPHYDVEFRVDRWEYEYEIHAETGEILSFERDD